MSILQWAQWLEGTTAASLVRDSQWGFQIVVAMHIVGLTLSVGMILWFDLRLLGGFLEYRDEAIVYRRLIPWAAAGFGLMFLSGGLLLAAYATAAYINVYFRLKLVALLLAGINALAYHQWASSRGAEIRPRWVARAVGLASIAAWATVIVAGRLMSYTMF